MSKEASLASEPTLEKTRGSFAKADASDLDVAAQLAAGAQGEAISEADALRIRKRIDWHILPLMCLIYLMAFMDKTTLGQSAVLGLEQDNHLTANQFNWLGTIFYLSYLAFEYPQNLALQHFPVAKWLSFNIFVWAVALCCHAACSSFGGLFACRFILGISEGAITAGFLIVTSMFYTHAEQAARVGYWFLMNGLAAIILGFAAFGVLHIKSGSFHPWQWLMIITGIITLITSVVFWFFFPDSPANAKFLSAEDKRLAVLRIRENQTGVENKHFKREHLIETLKDPKTWLFFVILALNQIPNSLTNQRQLIVNMFGFSEIQTTLLGCVDGVVVSLAIFASTKLSSRVRDCRAYATALWTIPGIVGGILVVTLPSHNRIGLLFSYWTALIVNGCLPVLLGWVNAVTAGHSKRISTNAIVLIAYGIGNASGPFMWKKQYQPRNRVPWAIMIGCNGLVAILSLLMRVYLANENKNRANLADEAAYDNVIVLLQGQTGESRAEKVDRAFLDLTDRQNLEFRYVL